jgi:ABC-type transport system involved in multi-copper enzyme maturation permease subunit
VGRSITVNASGLKSLPSERKERRFPLAGTALVFRKERRGRRAGRELLVAIVLLALLLAIAAGLQSLFFGQMTVYSNNETRFLLRWLTTETIAAALLLPCAGAILGAGAVPASAEREAIQATLLTHLTAWEIVTGRLLAALWIPLCVLGVSLLGWLGAQAGFHFLQGSRGAVGPLLEAHGVLLATLLMSGATGFLGALRARPGRAWERGAVLSLSLSLFCLFGLFTLNGPIRRMNNPTTLIDAALLINPISGLCAALDKDILRVPWIYRRTEAPEYPFFYPSPYATGGVLLLAALGAQTTASILLRRSYRAES